MSAWLRVVAIGGISIVAFDTLASVASKLAGFPYSYATYGSWLIYFVVGYFAARATNSVRRAALAGGMVGAVESTLGWAVSWMIGPGRPPEGGPDVPFAFMLVFAVTIVVATASAIAAVAGLMGRQRLSDVPSAP